jgi:hypothetical protein
MLLSPYVNDDARRYLEYLRSKYVQAGTASRATVAASR